MSTHDLETLAIEMVAKRLCSLPELVQLSIMSGDAIATTMFFKILDDMRGRLK